MRWACSPDIIRVDFERLATVPGLFTDEAERIAAALSAIEAQLPLLRAGWEGPAADIFFADMERDARPALRRLVHALRHGSDVSAVMLRVLDDAEQAAARIDWSGGGVVAAPDGTTDRPRVTDIDAPQLSPAPAGVTLGLPTFTDDPLLTRATVLHDLALGVPLTGYDEGLSPHTGANDGSGVVTRVGATGGLTLDPVMGAGGVAGGGGGGGALALLLAMGLMLYNSLRPMQPLHFESGSTAGDSSVPDGDAASSNTDSEASEGSQAVAGAQPAPSTGLGSDAAAVAEGSAPVSTDDAQAGEVVVAGPQPVPDHTGEAPVGVADAAPAQPGQVELGQRYTTPGGTKWQTRDRHHTNQVADRGWSLEAINEVLDNPAPTAEQPDGTHPAVDRTNPADPATAYYGEDGNNIVRNEATGEIIALSDRTNPGWNDDTYPGQPSRPITPRPRPQADQSEAQE